MKQNKKIIKFCMALIVIIGFVSGLNAQTNTDSYFPEFAPDRDMIYTAPHNNFDTKGIQYGGWITPTLMQNRGNNVSSYSATIARLWVKSYLWDDAFVYVRGKNSLTVTGIPDDTELDNIVDVDLAFLDMFFLNKELQVTVGRQYFIVGTGLVLNGRGDGVNVNYIHPDFSLKGFASYTGLLLKDDNPYGLNSADFSDGARRLFSGVVATKNITDVSHNVYAFGVSQIDLGKDSDEKYHSLYLGLGASGSWKMGLGYYGEFIYELGQARDRSGTNQMVNAMAINAGLEYKLKVVTEPILLLQYAYGSGDSDRTDSGKNGGGADRYFTYFGTFVGGYGLNPILGNLHIGRLGSSLQLFEWTNIDLLKRITTVFKYSLYMKSEKEAPINNSKAKENASFVGQGGDVALRWKIYSDLGLFANYGIFLPGSSFESNVVNQHFFLFGLNISF